MLIGCETRDGKGKSRGVHSDSFGKVEVNSDHIPAEVFVYCPGTN